MKTLFTDTVPALWKLGWDSQRHALCIHIAEAFTKSEAPIPKDSPVVRALENVFPDTLFNSFSGSLESPYFGFNQHIRRVGQYPPFFEGFTSFSVPLPRIRVETSMVCQECGGTKEREMGRSAVFAARQVNVVYTVGTAHTRLLLTYHFFFCIS